MQPFVKLLKWLILIIISFFIIILIKLKVFQVVRIQHELYLSIISLKYYFVKQCTGLPKNFECWKNLEFDNVG